MTDWMHDAKVVQSVHDSFLLVCLSACLSNCLSSLKGTKVSSSAFALYLAKPNEQRTIFGYKPRPDYRTKVEAAAAGRPTSGIVRFCYGFSLLKEPPLAEISLIFVGFFRQKFDLHDHFSKLMWPPKIFYLELLIRRWYRHT